MYFPPPFLMVYKNSSTVRYCCHALEPFSSRREVYGILKAEGILLPRYAVLNRDPNNPQGKN